MSDDMTRCLATGAPTQDQPLLGLTVLVVEDSLFACDALRLLCLRSGARMRRADGLASARRHLASYRPSVVIVDLGLPDGSGLDLIAQIAVRASHVPAILAISGDTDAENAALAAGADGFLAKPIESLRTFQSAVLGALAELDGLRAVDSGTGPGDLVHPDPLALRGDLSRAADMLGTGADAAHLDYLAKFLSGVALSANDAPLRSAAESLVAGPARLRAVNRVHGLVRDRLATAPKF